MTAEELVDAIKIKLIPRLNDLKEQLSFHQKRDIQVGDTIKVVRDYYDGSDPNKIIGKIGEVTELRDNIDYPYRIRFKEEICRIRINSMIVNRVKFIKRGKDWNLADCEQVAMVGKQIDHRTVRDIKTFIQKVNEDIHKAFETGVEHPEIDEYPLDDKEVEEIINKRAGDLDG